MRVVFQNPKLKPQKIIWGNEEKYLKELSKRFSTFEVDFWTDFEARSYCESYKKEKNGKIFKKDFRDKKPKWKEIQISSAY